LPAEAHELDARRFGLGADMGRRAGAVGLAERVPAGDERHGFLVVHGHAREGLANVARGGDRIGIAVRAFGIDVDETHLHGAVVAVEFAIAAIAAVGRLAVGEPGFLGAPVHVVLGLVDVGAAAAE